MLLSILCLDAPIVALAWQQLVAANRALPVAALSRVVLFATAWLIYLVDRFADSFTVPAGASISLRQAFVRSHRRAFIVAIAAAIAIDTWTIPQLDGVTIRAGGWVAGVLMSYLFVNHFFSRMWRIVPLKEIVIGSLFAAGVYASLAGGGRLHFDWSMALFGALCALNCISIAYWERDLDSSQDRSSLATEFPRASAIPLVFSLALALIAGGCAFKTARPSLFICAALSAGLLAILNRPRALLSSDARTALADIALLTPVLALPFS